MAASRHLGFPDHRLFESKIKFHHRVQRAGNPPSRGIIQLSGPFTRWAPKYPKSGSRRVINGVIKGSWDKISSWEQPKPSRGRSWGPKTARRILPSRWCTGTPCSYRTGKFSEAISSKMYLSAILDARLISGKDTCLTISLMHSWTLKTYKLMKELLVYHY